MAGADQRRQDAQYGNLSPDLVRAVYGRFAQMAGSVAIRDSHRTRKSLYDSSAVCSRRVSSGRMPTPGLAVLGLNDEAAPAEDADRAIRVFEALGRLVLARGRVLLRHIFIVPIRPRYQVLPSVRLRKILIPKS